MYSNINNRDEPSEFLIIQQITVKTSLTIFYVFLSRPHWLLNQNWLEYRSKNKYIKKADIKPNW